jgi:KDO2-lipid IV(A) lauroyltransferase
MYRLYAFAAKVVPHLPRGMILALAQVIGLAAWLVAGKARRQATANMLHVLGPDIRATRAGRRRLRKTVLSMFRYNVRNYLEALYLPPTKPEVIQRELQDITGEEHLEEALARGKGVILISVHLGPFNNLTQWFTVNGYNVTIPVERLKDERMLDLMLSLRRRPGVNFTPLGGSVPLRAMIAALRKNELVLITGDRAVVGESVERLFFDATARLPSGPINLAQRTDAMLVGAVGWYERQGRVGGHFTPISLAVPEEERADEERLHAKVVEMMEREIRSHPEQWVVFDPVWED